MIDRAIIVGLVLIGTSIPGQAQDPRPIAVTHSLSVTPKSPAKPAAAAKAAKKKRVRAAPAFKRHVPAQKARSRVQRQRSRSAGSLAVVRQGNFAHADSIFGYRQFSHYPVIHHIANRAYYTQRPRIYFAGGYIGYQRGFYGGNIRRFGYRGYGLGGYGGFNGRSSFRRCFRPFHRNCRIY